MGGVQLAICLAFETYGKINERLNWEIKEMYVRVVLFPVQRKSNV